VKLVLQIVADVIFAVILLANPSGALAIALLGVPVWAVGWLLGRINKPASYPENTEMLLRIAVEKGKTVALPLAGGQSCEARIISFDKEKLDAVDTGSKQAFRLELEQVRTSDLLAAIL
jgi:hypothetical protein